MHTSHRPVSLTRSCLIPCCLTLVFSFVISSTVEAQVSADQPQDYQVTRSARKALVGMKATVLHGGTASAYHVRLDDEQRQRLQRLGFDVQPLPPGEADEGVQEGGYTSYAQMRSDFVQYAATYPDIARFVVLGETVQGRDLFALRITDNPQKEEAEPELLFCGSIHGDEFASGEVPYLYAMRLLDEYGSDPDITAWVDSTEIWCVPLVNPDGHANGTRNNANNVDLNRDYGHQWDGWGNSPSAYSQPESKAMRAFFRANNFSLVATMHCTGNVLFYPWGFSPWNATDLSTINRVGLRYTQAANYALSNSWADYETHGEVLDDIYGSHGALCYTVEMSNTLGALPTTYTRNRDGMDAFCASMNDGLHIEVTDARTGLPLRAAIRVSGSQVPSFTDPIRGDAHRIVLPGTYEVTVSANGHRSSVISNVVVAAGAPAQLQVALKRGAGDTAFEVVAVNQRDPQNNFDNVTAPFQALGPADGVPCSLGAEGWIVLDLGAGHEVHDGPGVDLLVTEAAVPGDMLPENYQVFVGDVDSQTVLVASGQGTTGFDLAGTGVSSARFVRIVDASGAAPTGAYPGMDLDAVRVLNGPTLVPDDAAAKTAP